MNNNTKKKVFILLISILMAYSCAVQKPLSEGYSGDWNFYASSGTTGIIRIVKGEAGYEATLITSYGEKPITNFVLVGKHVSGNFEVMGSDVQMEGDIKGKHLSGTLVSSGQIHTIEAYKAKKPK